MTLGPTLLDADVATCGAHAPVTEGGRDEPARHRCVQLLDRFELESGEVLRQVEQAYFLDGSLNEARDNLVVVFHALTGSADAVGEWWRDVVGSGHAIADAGCSAGAASTTTFRTSAG